MSRASSAGVADLASAKIDTVNVIASGDEPATMTCDGAIAANVMASMISSDVVAANAISSDCGSAMKT